MHHCPVCALPATTACICPFFLPCGQNNSDVRASGIDHRSSIVLYPPAVEWCLAARCLPFSVSVVFVLRRVYSTLLALATKAVDFSGQLTLAFRRFHVITTGRQCLSVREPLFPWVTLMLSSYFPLSLCMYVPSISVPRPLRLCALSSGDPSSVVSSFPAGDSPVRGVCLVVRRKDKYINVSCRAVSAAQCCCSLSCCCVFLACRVALQRGDASAAKSWGGGGGRLAPVARIWRVF